MKKFGFVYKFSVSVARIPFLIFTKRVWTGQENLPQEGGFIVVSNHVTELDSLTFLHYLVDNGYPMRVLAKDALFRVPVLGWLLRTTGQLPVYRATDKSQDSLQAAKCALRDGECVGLFPDGTLTRDPNLWPMKGKTGAARMALDTQVPVIPLAQWGAHRIRSPYKGHWKLLPVKTVRMHAGKPVDLSAFYGKQDDWQAVNQATEVIMKALTNELAKMRPGETPPVMAWDIERDGDPYQERRLPDGRSPRWWRKKTRKGTSTDKK